MSNYKGHGASLRASGFYFSKFSDLHSYLNSDYILHEVITLLSALFSSQYKVSKSYCHQQQY